jgi:hypothetical protein
MLPFLSLHALAAQRGDGLRPELLALFERHAGLETGLAAIIGKRCFLHTTEEAWEPSSLRTAYRRNAAWLMTVSRTLASP